MKNLLKEEILKRMKEKNLSISGLERKAGLHIHSVRNLVKGRVKNPNARTLQAIAEVLECTILDLMNIPFSKGTVTSTKSVDSSTPVHLELMEDCFKTVTRVIKEKEMNLSTKDYLDYIMTVYSYSTREEPKKVELKFVNWVLEDQFIED